MNYLALLLSVAIANSAGLIGAFFTSSSVSGWYTTLTLPSFTPSGGVIGTVWTILYVLMGIAAFLVWKNRKKKTARRALQVYGVHLVLNTLWSIIFFGMQNPGFAFIEILILWGFIVWTMVLFYRENKVAMWLLVPYLAWVSFASFLNASIYLLN